MKGLLLKDCYTLIKQGKLLILIIIVLAVVPVYAMTGFSIIYASMLPLTALAYDERAKWDCLAAMMPYSEKSVVFGKYIIGYVTTTAATIISVIAKIVVGFFTNNPANPMDLITIVIMGFMALLITSLQMPFLFRFGVEKGRFISMAFIIAAVLGVNFGLETVGKMELTRSQLVVILAVAGAGAIVLNVASIFISAALYKRRKR